METELRDALLVLLASLAILVWCFSPVWSAWLHRRAKQGAQEREED